MIIFDRKFFMALILIKDSDLDNFIDHIALSKFFPMM